MKNHFGELVQRLRVERGLSQPKLGALAGFSEGTVKAAERSAACTLKRSTAVNLFKALEDASPLSPPDREEFLKLAQLDAIVKSAQHAIVQHTRGVELVDQMYANLGESFTNEVLTLLNAVYSKGYRDCAEESRAAQRTADSSPQVIKGFDMSVHHPIVSRDGMNIQKITHYDRADAAAAEADATAKKATKRKGA